MSTALTLYNSACTALSKARTLLDVKDVADKSAALKEYARLTKDRTLEIQAAELRIRSERELGKRLAATERNQGGVCRQRNTPSDPQRIGARWEDLVESAATRQDG